MRLRLPILSLVLLGAAAAGLPAERIPVPRGIDHTDYTRLLATYVDSRGLVDYAGWKDHDGDLASLDRYLAQFVLTDRAEAEGDERTAALVNAYNAFTLQWILRNYPTESIRLLDDSWPAERHRIGRGRHSLEQIEHENLRPELGWKVHSLIVCAARSCPPLQQEAVTTESLDAMVEKTYRIWLARPDLNRYEPDRNRVEISQIFDWFAEDFTGSHSVRAILARYGPARHRGFLAAGDYRIGFMDYHWGLNDQSGLGRDYRHSLLKSLF